jgi:rod shape-determining protein MreD
VKAAWVLLASAAAIALQSSIDRWVQGGGGIDLVLIVVVYNALTAGRVSGMLMGTFAGLIQDALSGGVIGMAGLSKTVVGYLVGIVSTQFIVTHSITRFVVFFLATALNAVVFMGLYEMLGLRHFGLPYASVAGQGLANAVVGVLAFKAVELLPGAVERRRLARSSFRR